MSDKNNNLPPASLGAGGIWTPVDGVANGWAKLQLVVDWAADTAAVLTAADAAELAAIEPDEAAAATEDEVAIAPLLLAAAAGVDDEATAALDEDAAAAGVLTD
ncbi:unnamed protein product [Umbelopsis sp. WA50703]